MAISLSCPGCESTLNVAESLIGKTIKCKTCGEMLPVREPAKVASRKATAVLDDDDDRPFKKSSRRQDDDDDDDRPSKTAKGGSKVPLFAGLAVGALALLGGGIGGAYFLFGKKEPEVVQTQPVKNTNPTPAGDSAPVEPKSETKTTPVEQPKNEKTDNQSPAKTPEETKQSTPEQTKPVTTKAAEPPKTTDTTTKTTEQPISQPPSAGLSSSDKQRVYNSGELDDVAMKQCKRGTVLIRCESKFGGGGSGSGWFGIEENIVITNAHVISMIAPNSPPPAKLTVIINPGEYGQNPGIKEREIPHQRIKIIAVDRHYDIAILQISGENDLPPPFKIKPTAELKENQGISIMGYPLADAVAIATGSKKNPAVSVRKSTVAALRYDEYGILRNLQVQGGISPGNSGGPQFDGDGKVCAMTVAQMVRDTTIGLSVPTEHILGLLAGRIDEVDIDVAFNKDGMVHIPVRVKAQDPLKRLKSVGVAYWVGESSGILRPPGETRKGILNSDKDFKEISLKYDPATKEAKGTVVLPQLTPGLSYWIQPFYQNSIVAKYYLPGTKIDTHGPPVDLQAANLTVNLKPGPIRPFSLERSSSQDEYAEGEGRSKEERIKFKIQMKGTEQIQAKAATDTQSAARLRLKYNDADIKVDIGQEVPFLPARQLKQLKDGIKQLEAYAFVNNSGQIYKTQTILTGVTDPIVRALGPAMSTNVLGSLQACSIALPNKEMNPNETWGGTTTIGLSLSFLDNVRNNMSGGRGQPPRGGRPRPGDGDDDNPMAGGGNNQQVVAKREFLMNKTDTYTYQGVRMRSGRKEAVVKVEGKIVPSAGMAKDSANGEIKGLVFIDIATGIILEANIESDFELDTSIQGLKQRSYSSDVYKLTRDGNVK